MMHAATPFVIAGLVILAAMLTACDVAQMPPCSALVVIGSVTYDCDAPPHGTKPPT